MKNNANNQNQDQLNELENDAVWTLLDKTEQASPIEASPMFARNVMREVRVNHDKETCASPSLWQRILAPKFNKIALSLCAVTACAVMAFTIIPGQNTESETLTGETKTSDLPDELSLEDLATYSEIQEEEFTNKMLDLSDQDPFYISEEEIEIAMQM